MTFVGSAWSFGVFHPRHNGQWPSTSKDFLSQILSITFIFLSKFLRKSQYFPFWMFSAKQGHYWYHFYSYEIIFTRVYCDTFEKEQRANSWYQQFSFSPLLHPLQYEPVDFPIKFRFCKWYKNILQIYNRYLVDKTQALRDTYITLNCV